jgi:predicted nucleotidyltransferase
MDLIKRAADLVELIASLGHECALVGGLAVSTRGRERFTRDIDFAVAVASDREAETLTFGLQGHGFELRQVIEQDAKGVLGTVRFRHPEDQVDEPSVDLLFGSTGIEREIVTQATQVEIAPEVFVPVARLPHLVAMKVLAEREEREQDRADLRVLLRVATDPEVQETRDLVRLIEERGFNRGKDVTQALQRFMAEMRPRGRQS